MGDAPIVGMSYVDCGSTPVTYSLRALLLVRTSWDTPEARLEPLARRLLTDNSVLRWPPAVAAPRSSPILGVDIVHPNLLSALETFFPLLEALVRAGTGNSNALGRIAWLFRAPAQARRVAADH